MLRGIEVKETWEKIRYMLFPMEGFQTLTYEEMSGITSIEEAHPLLQKANCYCILERALERYHQEKSLFPLEVALDLNY